MNAAITGTFHRGSHHSIRKLVTLKLSLVSKLFTAWLKFITVIVQSKTEIVQTTHIVQSAARIIGETVSK